MKQPLRCLLVAVLLLILLVGLDYAEVVDVPGVDPTELGLGDRTSVVESLGPRAPSEPPPPPTIRRTARRHRRSAS
jgi:hypothetical protein